MGGTVAGFETRTVSVWAGPLETSEDFPFSGSCEATDAYSEHVVDYVPTGERFEDESVYTITIARVPVVA